MEPEIAARLDRIERLLAELVGSCWRYTAWLEKDKNESLGY